MEPNHNWQESLAAILESVPEKDRRRVRDFLVGYLAGIKEEGDTHEEDRV